MNTNQRKYNWISNKIRQEQSFHQWQHAYFAAPRTKRGGMIVGVPKGICGQILRTMIDIIGYYPDGSVADNDCRQCIWYLETLEMLERVTGEQHD